MKDTLEVLKEIQEELRHNNFDDWKQKPQAQQAALDEAIRCCGIVTRLPSEDAILLDIELSIGTMQDEPILVTKQERKKIAKAIHKRLGGV